MPQLVMKNIHKAFHKVPVLRGVDLSVEPGEVVAILGPSGSGKTTLLRCINYLERPQEGAITLGPVSVDCRHPSRAQIQDLRKRTGMVFQHYNLFKNKTALQNITEGLVVGRKVPKVQAESAALALLEKVGLGDRKDSYPSQLSGGQQQRVGIARALALEPDVILLDEPTSALDPELVGEVLRVVRGMADEGQTMVIVTHEVAFARDVADRVIFLDGGVVVEQGPPADIFTNPQEPRTRQFLQRIMNEWSFSI